MINITQMLIIILCFDACTLSTNVSYKYSFNFFFHFGLYQFNFRVFLLIQQWKCLDCGRILYSNKRYTGHCGFFFGVFIPVCKNMCVMLSIWSIIDIFFGLTCTRRLPERIVSFPNKTAIFNATKHWKIIWSCFVQNVLLYLKSLRLHIHYRLVW